MNKDKIYTFFKFIGLFTLSVFLVSCSIDNKNPMLSEEYLAPSSTNDNKPILQWIDLLLSVVKDNSISPPVASRIFAYAGVTFYEGISANHFEMRSLEGQLNGLAKLPKVNRRQNYDSITIASTAEKVVMLNIFANDSQTIKNKIIQLWQNQIDERQVQGIPLSAINLSKSFGEVLGNTISIWANNDGYSMYNNCSYIPPTGNGYWEPTPPNYANALLPCWGKLRPFIMSYPDEFDPGPPPPYSENPNSKMYKEAYEVYETVNNLTPEQEAIATFWADGAGTITPPGHSIYILKHIIDQYNLALIPSSRAFARLSIGLADAFISVWDTKYKYNVLRPETYINKLIDPNWKPFLVTPPFPEYTSGHSVQSGAMEAIMTAMFGNIKIIDNTYQPSRSFNSFRELANETGFSRLYGGIHYRTCTILGLEQGRKIGLKVMRAIKMI